MGAAQRTPSCENCAFYPIVINSPEPIDYNDSPCAKCPLARDDYFQSSEIGYDNSFLDKNTQIYLFIERILSTFKKRRTVDVARLMLSLEKPTSIQIARRLKISQTLAFWHMKKIKRNLPELFK